MKVIIRNGHIIDPSTKLDKVADILIEDGKISKIGKKISVTGRVKTIDATGKIVAPGFIDMHTHLREPGGEAKEDFISGSRAAAAGGFTTVATMPNTKPVIDNAILVRGMQKRAEDVGVVKIEIIGALTKQQEGEQLAEIGAMIHEGVVALSDDGHFDGNSRVMLNAMDYIKSFNKAIMSHAEETSLVIDGCMNEGVRSAMLGMKGRPPVAEDIAVSRELLLAEYTGAWIHISHISTKGAIELVRQAKARGVHVTTEVTPHHLILTEDAVDPTDSSTKVNPPLRTTTDIEAAFAGLMDGTIDMIATDHAPHTIEEKDREYKLAPSGFPGFETALGLMLTHFYHNGKMTLPELIEKMSCAPGRIFFDSQRGSFANGCAADIVIFDPATEWIVDASKFFTKGRHTPYQGMKLTGKVEMTLVDGKVVFNKGKIK